MKSRQFQRRQLLKAGLAGLGTTAFSPVVAPGVFSRVAHAAAAAAADDRILVVLELSGGNDGLNTVVPYAEDAYYRLRPSVGIPEKKLLKLDDRFGLNPGMAGFERLWKDGQLAIVHGCGYENPSFSHFTSMAYWHTATPNSGDDYGWVGRLADTMSPQPTPNYVLNIDSTQSLAVRSRVHTPVVFDDPERFMRSALHEERALLDDVTVASRDNPSRRFLEQVAVSARESSLAVREAWSRYKTPIDYGIVPLGLPKVAACIAAGLPARLYYAGYRNNAFDTHVQQTDLHQRLLTYVSDAVAGFVKDLQRIGRADDVAVLVYSEFGRRPAENTSLGTDHGTANHMYVVGTRVKGGHFGEVPSLTQLDETGNQRHTTDFRRVYASLIEGWLGHADSAALLYGRYETLPLWA